MEPHIRSEGPAQGWTNAQPSNKKAPPKDEAAKVGEKTLEKMRKDSSDSDGTAPKSTDSKQNTPREHTKDPKEKEQKVEALRKEIIALSKERVKNPERTEEINHQLQVKQKDFNDLRSELRENSSQGAPVEYETKRVLWNHVTEFANKKLEPPLADQTMYSLLQNANKSNFASKLNLFQQIGNHFARLSGSQILNTDIAGTQGKAVDDAYRNIDAANKEGNQAKRTEFFAKNVLPPIFSKFDSSGISSQAEKDKLKVDFIKYMNAEHNLKLPTDLSTYSSKLTY